MINMYNAFVLATLALATLNAQIDDNCLNCICQVESGCDANIGCIWDVGSYSCGPFQIKENYYIDCSYESGDWKTCANSLDCAKDCVRNYTQLYGTHCTDGEDPTCEDYARIHEGGPYGCQSSATLNYWEKVKKCYQQ